MLKVKIRPSIKLPDGTNTYQEYHLAFEPAYPLPMNPPRNSIDPLLGIKVPQQFLIHIWTPLSKPTFTIAAVDYTLYSFDTFTSPSEWILEQKLQLPRVEEQGLLVFEAEFPNDNIITIQRSTVDYRVNYDSSLVQIRFDKVEDIYYVRVASCLVAGIDKEANLAEIWLENFALEKPMLL